MATKLVEIRECDRCGKDSEVTTWVITGPEGGSREIELCTKHSAAVANLFALARPAQPPPRVVTPGSRSRRLTRPPSQRRTAVVPAEPEPVWR